jgi:formiminotetrahydrofolate cyclodeaminase
MSYAFLEQPLSVFLDRVASDEPAPGGGACAAVTVGLAAGLCAMAARFSSTTVADAATVVEQAEALRHRVQGLAQQDAEAYTQVLQAFQLPKEPDPDARRQRIEAALSAAAEPPLAVAEAAVEVGRLARRLEAEGNPNLRGDAVTGRLLAEAGCRAAAELVAANLPAGAPRRERAEALAGSWAAAG